jgi:hypothetical protein
MTMATVAKKTIDWQFPDEKQQVTLDDFRTMVRNGERAPHISLEEFYKITDEWLNNSSKNNRHE